MSSPQKNGLLLRIRAFCLRLPEVTEQTTGHHLAFQVGNKTFAYFLDNHHNDGIVGIACKVLPGDNTALIAAHPKKFYMPAYIGPRGWVALRLDIGKPSWNEIAELITHSYLAIAPQKLAALIHAQA